MKIPFLRDGPERPSRMINASILRSSFERRAVVIGAVQGGIGVLLALRLGYLAVAENEKYRLESESNRVNLTLVPPRRGWILDRNGAPLASNRADFRVDLIPERLGNLDRTIRILGEVLSPFEMAHRGFRETNAVLRGLNEVLEGQAKRIASALAEGGAAQPAAWGMPSAASSQGNGSGVLVWVNC